MKKVIFGLLTWAVLTQTGCQNNAADYDYEINIPEGATFTSSRANLPSPETELVELTPEELELIDLFPTTDYLVGRGKEGMQRFRVPVEIRNRTKYPLYSVEVQVTYTNPGGKTYTTQTVASPLTHRLGFKSGTLGGYQLSDELDITYEIPNEYWTSGRKFEIHVSRAKRVVPESDLSTPYNLIAYMLYAEPDELEKVLEEHPEYLDSVDTDGFRLFEAVAAYRSHDELKKLISQGQSPDYQLTDGRTPLHVAAFTANIDTAKFLIEQGLDVNARDNYGQTPLHHAVVGQFSEMIKFLVEQGADVNALSTEVPRDINAARDQVGGVTPIQLASILCRPEFGQLLADLGADLSVKSTGGWTTLQMYCRKFKPDGVLLCIKNGGDINDIDPTGIPMLHKVRNEFWFRFILENGGDPDIKNASGDTCVEYWEKTVRNPYDLRQTKQTFEKVRKELNL